MASRRAARRPVAASAASPCPTLSSARPRTGATPPASTPAATWTTRRCSSLPGRPRWGAIRTIREDRCPDIVSLDPSPGADRRGVRLRRGTIRGNQRAVPAVSAHGRVPAGPSRDIEAQRPVLQRAEIPALSGGAFAAVRRRTRCARSKGSVSPTEAEWEKAGRGGNSSSPPHRAARRTERLLPWDDPVARRRKYRTCENAGSPDCYRDTKQVGSHPSSRSPYGVDEMLGNVEEWTRGCAISYEECAPTCVDPWAPCAEACRPGLIPPVGRHRRSGGVLSWRTRNRSSETTTRRSFERRCLRFRCVSSAPEAKSVQRGAGTGTRSGNPWNGGRHDL